MRVDVIEKGIIPVIEGELETFENEVKAFRSGERDEIAFQVYRLREGTYGQRQPDSQMVRVKIPAGMVTAHQLEALGDIAEKYAPLGKGHITTRENVQYHHLKLEEAAEAKWRLAQVGLTSREACGNTVRNVITCPRGGICKNETFDVTPYLAAYCRYFVRKPFTQNMPRKWKTSFSPCASDCAVAPMHDLGFVAAITEIDGVPRKGFRMYIGGGTSIMPREAQPLYDFVPVEEYLRVSEAALRVFNASDELRKNRMMARIKVLIDRIGMDAFREKVEAELQQEWAKDPIDPEDYWVPEYEEVPRPLESPNGHHAGEADAGFLPWRLTNARPQRQPGYYAAYTKVPSGDLSAAQFYGLARLSRNYGNGVIRFDFEQNLVFRWVAAEKLYPLWQELRGLGLGEAGVHEITDVTSCPGTDSCKLGITASMGAGRALRNTLLEMDVQDPSIKGMHVKISGCPNGCGRHHLASIGFQGAAIKGDGGHQVPSYEVYVGGYFEDGDDFQYARRVTTKVPAKRAPDAMKRIIRFYEEHREENEPFHRFVNRVGPKAFEPVLEDLKVAGPVAENLDLYQDWERVGMYVLERGEGECAV